MGGNYTADVCVIEPPPYLHVLVCYLKKPLGRWVVETSVLCKSFLTFNNTLDEIVVL